MYYWYITTRDTATSKDVVTEMMQNENYNQFFKSIIKEAAKEEQAEYRQTIVDLQTKVSDLQTQKTWGEKFMSWNALKRN